VPDETKVNFKKAVCDSEFSNKKCIRVVSIVPTCAVKYRFVRRKLDIFHGDKQLLFEFIRFCKSLMKHKQGIMSDRTET
jgi:hypothetical protein